MILVLAFSSFQMMYTGGESKREHEDKGKKRGWPRGKVRSKLEILTEGVTHPDTVGRRTTSSSTLKLSLKKKTPTPTITLRQKDPSSTSKPPTTS